MRTHPHEQLSSHTPVTQPLTTLWSGHLSTQTSRLENNLSHFIFCTIPLHINRNWMSQLKWCLKANLLFSDFYATVSLSNHKIWNGTFTFSLLCGHEWISCWISFHNFLWNNISGSSAPKHGGIFLNRSKVLKYMHASKSDRSGWKFFMHFGRFPVGDLLEWLLDYHNPWKANWNDPRGHSRNDYFPPFNVLFHFLKSLPGNISKKVNYT